MDLGATLCTRSSPDCTGCPVAAGCEAHRLGRQADFPGSKPKREKPVRSTTFVIITTPGGEVYLERRPENGIWGGLWCFPEAESAEAARRLCLARLADEPGSSQALPGLRHSFSHYHLDIAPVLLTLTRTPTLIAEGDALRAFSITEVPGVGLAAPVRKIWNQTAAALQNSGSDYPQGELHL
jgi:A/G-specific adenine glycosylase